MSKYKQRLFLCLVSFAWLCNGSVTMASSEEFENSKDLDQTPTWAVGCVCTVFILVSIILEKSLHKIGTVWNQFETIFFVFSIVIDVSLILGFCWYVMWCALICLCFCRSICFLFLFCWNYVIINAILGIFEVVGMIWFLSLLTSLFMAEWLWVFCIFSVAGR